MPRRVLMGRFLSRRGRFDKPVSTVKLAEQQADRQERRRKAKEMAEQGKVKPEAAAFGLADSALAQLRADERAARRAEQ